MENLHLKTAFVGLTSLALIGATTLASAQDYTHPRDLNMPASSFERPNPADIQQKLGNGLVTYVIKDERVPLATISAFIKMGKISDDKQGAAEALAYSLRNGAGVKGFKQSLRSMTADFSVTLHDEWAEINLNVPAEDFREGIQLFIRLIQNPKFDQSAIDALKATARNNDEGEAADKVYDGSMAVAINKFHKTIYAGHEYGYVPTKQDYAKLTPADIMALYRQFFVGGNMTMAVSGDFKNVIVDLRNDTAGFISTSAPKVKTVGPVKDKPASKTHFKAEKLLTWAVVGHAIPQVPVEDQAALEVMNYILGGGHFWTRMFIETRDKYGLTNDSSGFFQPHWYGPGSYSFHFYGRHEKFTTLYDNSMGEVFDMGRKPITDDEINVAKSALAEGEFEVLFNTGTAAARTFAIEYLRYGNHERSASYVDRVRALTKDDVLAAAKKYIRKQHMQSILVGNDFKLD